MHLGDPQINVVDISGKLHPHRRFTKAELRQGRTPDFRVFAGDELAFYCQVKEAQEDE